MRKLLGVLAILLAFPAFGQWTDRGDAKRILGKPIDALSASVDGRALTYDYATGTMKWQLLPLASITPGSSGQVLTMGASVPQWGSAANIDLKLFTSGTGGVLEGTVTTVGSKTACSSAGTTTITCTMHGLTLYPGDLVRVTSATTAADVGMYSLISSGVSTLVVSRALAGSDADVALTVYRNGLWAGPVQTMVGGPLVLNSNQTSATVAEYGLDIHYTAAKMSGSSDDYGLRVNRDADTGSPGTSYLAWFGEAGTARFTIPPSGSVVATGGVIMGANRLQADSNGNIYMRNTSFIGWSNSSFYSGTKDLTIGRNTAGVFEVTAGTDGTADGRIVTGSYMSQYTLDATTQVGMIVCIDESQATCTGDCVSACASGSEKPIGVYVGTAAGTAHASTLYLIATGGKAYLIPEEDHADVALGDVIVTATGTGGYAEFSASVNPVTHNQEVGHAIRASAKITFNGADTGSGGDVNLTTNVITLDSSPGWAVDDPVVYWDSGDTEPTGMTDGAVYWIKTISGADVTLSTSKGGSTLDITAGGSGTTMYLQKLVWANLHWN